MRTFFNLLIATGLLLVLNAFGWLTLKHDNTPIDFNHLTWSSFGSIALVAVVLWLVGVLVALLYLMAGCFTLGLMFLAYPFLGWATLKLTAHFMPDTLALHGFWITALCGFILMVVKIHPPKKVEASAHQS